MAATAAMALDNVIRFPDATRDPVVGSDGAPSLKGPRDFLARKLRESIRSLLPEIEEEMLTRGDLCDERTERNLYYGAAELLKANAVRIEGHFAANWLRLFDEAFRGDVPRVEGHAAELDELQLVGLGDLDEELAGKAIASQLRHGCEDTLFAVGRRLAFLAGRDDGVIAVAELLAAALRAAVADIGFSERARLEMLRAFGRHAVQGMSPAIDAANVFLIGRNVLPNLRRSYAKPSAGKPKAADAHSAAVASDTFALLQRLVNAGAAGGGVAAAAGASFGQPGQGGSTTSMALAMGQVMASLDVLQRSMPPTIEGTPTTNVLHEFRASDAGQTLGYIDAVTADIVATLFDFIFDDPAIADPIKALIGRMQIPVLKVAMLDKSFFSSKAHPARRLLDGISRAAVRCGPAVGHEDPLYARVAEIIEHLQNEFNQDTGLFDVLCTELDTFLDELEAAADERAAPLVVAQEEREIAALAADQALAGWLAMPLPEAVSEILSHEWRSLLVRCYLDGDQEAWTTAVGTVAELVASVQPHPDVRQRRLLAANLPMLVKRIHDILDRSRVPDARRLALIDSLFGLHAAVLRGASPEVAAMPSAPLPAAEPEIAGEVIVAGDTRLDSISLADCGVPPEKEGGADVAADLRRGDWVEFMDAESGFVRYRLAWISPQRGIMLFTNSQSPRALSIAPAALAVRIRRGEAAIMSAEPIFDRAVNRALESLKAA